MFCDFYYYSKYRGSEGKMGERNDIAGNTFQFHVFFYLLDKWTFLALEDTVRVLMCMPVPVLDVNKTTRASVT